MANLKHVVSDLHQVYLAEMEAKIKPQLDKSSASSSGSGDGEKKDSAGGGGDNVQKAARQLAYDTRYKARREGIPLERAFTQSVQNSSAPAPVKDAAKSMLFKGGDKNESFEIEEGRKGDKEKVRVTPKKGYGDAKGYVRFADAKKKHELRANPQIQSVTPTDHGDAYEGEDDKKKSKKKSGKLDPVGQEDGDVNNDGKKDSSDKYLMKRRKAIGKAIAKTKKEEFSNWKAELGLEEETMVEVAGEEKSKKITEKNVKNKIEIHPDLKEGIAKLGGEVLEVEEVDQIDEITAMAKRGHDETAIRNKIAKSTGGGKSADRATALADKPTYGNDKAAKQRSDLARKQRGDFRKTASSSPGLHGYGHKSDDPKVKAKQAARGAQRGALTPNEKKSLNREEVEQIGEERPVDRLDRLNRERIAKQKAAKDAETAKRDQRISDFKSFRAGERAKGTRHDHILDKWQQKKIAADKAKKQ